MTTIALMAWTGSDRALDPATPLLIERHHGHLDWYSGVAVFPGAAAALAAAVDWQQHPAATVALAVTVAELEPTSPTATAYALSAVWDLLEGAHHGGILATDVVRLLMPAPACGTWADEIVSGGRPSTNLYGDDQTGRSASRWSWPRMSRSSERASSAC